MKRTIIIMMSGSYDNNCNKSDNIYNNNNTYSEWYLWLEWWEIIISITGNYNENDNEQGSNNDDDSSDI